MDVNVSDSGSGSDYISFMIGLSIGDVGTGTTSLITVELQLTDSSRGLEVITSPIHVGVLELGKAAEFGWQAKGYVRLDIFDLPHVAKIRLMDNMSTARNPVMRSKPHVSKVGKMGRIVTIEGWVDNMTDVETLRAFKDGKVHSFIHPSGDSFPVRVNTFSPDNVADQYGRRVYTLTLWEVRGW